MLLKLRTQPIIQLNPQIDRKNLVIRNAVAMTSGIEASGHGVMADGKTLMMMLALSQQKSRGIPQFFGHTGISENGMGRKIGKAMNFRIEGNTLRHDIQYFKPATQSPVFNENVLDYIFDMVAQHPEEIGESVVIQADTVWTFADGLESPAVENESRPTAALTDYPVMRPTAFYSVDVVTEGALTPNGMFEAFATQMFDGTSSEYAQQFFEEVDAFRLRHGIRLEDVPFKINQITKAYLTARGHKKAMTMTDFTNDNDTVEMPDELDVMLEHAQDAATALEQVTAQKQSPVKDAHYAKLESEVARLKQIVELQQKSIALLTQQVISLSGERVVMETVPMNFSAIPTMPQTPPPASMLGSLPTISDPLGASRQRGKRS
jgi:hypothetical protein